MTIKMVDCGVCSRVHEDLFSVDCRAFRTCHKCGGLIPEYEAKPNH